jgi:hypothetical protein
LLAAGYLLPFMGLDLFGFAFTWNTLDLSIDSEIMLVLFLIQAAF